MLNPISKARTAEDVARYRAEPYVVAADVYSNPAHIGRGGWTWYTGSASWMYRVAIGELLGLTLKRGSLHVDPCIPPGWQRYEATLRTSQAIIRIIVENPEGLARGVRVIELDGVPIHDGVLLADAVGSHVVRVVLGRSVA